MTTIDSVECWVLRAPIAEPLANAFGAMSNRPALFLRVSASDGAWGWGEAFCNFPQVGAEHRARLVDSLFAPLLRGACADAPRPVRARLEHRTARMAIQCGEPGPFAQIVGAVDQAMWDLVARRAGLPLWRLLRADAGEPRERKPDAAAVRVYASGIGPDRVVQIALGKRDEGYRAFKLKVGFDAGLDRDNLAAMREALGPDATIMCDANQAWTPEEAVGRIAALAPARPHWIEEPIMADEPHEAWRALARARARCRWPPARTCAASARSGRRSTRATCASCSPTSASGAASTAACRSRAGPPHAASRTARTGSPAGSGWPRRCMHWPHRTARTAGPRSTRTRIRCARRCSRSR